MKPSVRDTRPPRVNILRQIWVVFWVGAVMATLFTAWTPLGIFPIGLIEGIQAAISPEEDGELLLITPTPRPRPRVGIVAGHWGSDSGTVCDDGLTEQEVNQEIATLVKESLVAAGLDVDLLMENDDLLPQYQARALVSIHADSCAFVDINATGFKVAATLATTTPEKTGRLVACLYNRYQTATGLPFHSGSITSDMTSYHAFDEIDSDTTAAIIETGFLNLDRQILTQNQYQVAQGISEGILCFIYNQDAELPSQP